MDIPIADVLFHVPADLATQDRDSVERILQGCDGVISAHFVHGKDHMLEVAYNPDAVKATELRSHLMERGLAATMVGM